jgi:hypothetical protein
MGAIQSPTRDLDHQNGHRSEGRADLDAPEVWPELDALLKKSEQLLELVTRLSNFVIGNVVDDRDLASGADCIPSRTMEEGHAHQDP